MLIKIAGSSQSGIVNLRYIIMWIGVVLPFFLLSGAGLARGLDKVSTPSKTYVFIPGVLPWQDKELVSFSSKLRKDKELYELFFKRGVPASNMVLLLDEEATLKSMRNSLKELIGKVKPGDIFIFYYAGHGFRKDKEVYFANYDMDTEKASDTGFAVSELISAFVGKKTLRILLLADCCYSGALGAVAKALGSRSSVSKGDGLQVASITSAEACNESTGNWTFSQTLLGALSGKSLIDANSDGVITLGDLNTEVSLAMRHREKQRSGNSFNGMENSFVLSPVENKVTPAKFPSWAANRFKIGDYILGENALHKPQIFEIFPSGAMIRVLWEGNEYDALIKHVDNGFHLITYSGWPDYWDEWVMSDRIICLKSDQKKRRPCKVKWQNTWYPALVYREGSKGYFIHYDGHDSNWDEWVEKERIRFK